MWNITERFKDFFYIIRKRKNVENFLILILMIKILQQQILNPKFKFNNFFPNDKNYLKAYFIISTRRELLMKACEKFTEDFNSFANLSKE